MGKFIFYISKINIIWLLILELKSTENVSAGHSNRIFSVKFHPTDSNILVSGGWDDTIQIWDLEAEKSIKSIYGPHVCGDSLGFDQKGKSLVVGSYGSCDQLKVKK